MTDFRPEDAPRLIQKIRAGGYDPRSIGWLRVVRYGEVSRREAEHFLQYIHEHPEVLSVPDTPKEDPLLDEVKRLLRRRRRASITELSTALDRGVGTIKEVLGKLKEMGYNIALTPDQEVKLRGEVQPGNVIEITHDLKDFQNQWYHIGATGDWHLCNRQQRLDVLNAAYDIYEAEGIDTVYCPGNWIDGESRFNKTELLVHGLDNQIDYWIDHVPRKPGITTYFVAGDDHEGWYQQREGIEIGRYAMQRAQAAGRDDLIYLGYLEADVEFKVEGGSRWMKVMHPGGGSAYAISYTGQKLAECVPLDSEILTKTGWKKWDELTVGEEVLGYDVEQDRCEWTVLRAVNSYPEPNEVVHYENGLFRVKCTRDHRWAIEAESRGGSNKNSVYPSQHKPYRNVRRLLQSLKQTKKRSRIVQAAKGPEGPGADWTHEDFLDRKVPVGKVLRMTSLQRRAFINALLLGEGTRLEKSGTITFSQRPGPVQDAFVLACFLEGIATGQARIGTKKINGEVKTCCRTTMLKKRMRLVNSGGKPDSLRETGVSHEPVWCPTTDLGTWVMRQGSTITITGNSLQGGEKPAVILQGHYHKFNLGYPREIFVLDTGTCCDQTIFMRKRKIQAHVGFCILDMHQARFGPINRVRGEFIPFYDRGYYTKKLRKYR